MVELNEQLEALYITKEIDKIDEPFILNKFVGFNKLLWQQAELINKYLFRCNKKILKGLMAVNVPKFSQVPFCPYIKEIKEEGSQFKFLLDKIKKLYNWSEKDLSLHLPILLKIFEDKENLKDYFRFFGVEKKYYKKFEVEFEVKEAGLNKWFGG